MVTGNVIHNVKVNGNVNHIEVLLKQYIIVYTLFGIVAKSWEIFCIPNRINVLALNCHKDLSPLNKDFTKTILAVSFKSNKLAFKVLLGQNRVSNIIYITFLLNTFLVQI